MISQSLKAPKYLMVSKLIAWPILLPTSGTGWGDHTSTVVLCADCHSQFESWLLPSPRQRHQDGPDGALADTAMHRWPWVELPSGAILDALGVAASERACASDGGNQIREFADFGLRIAACLSHILGRW